MSRIVFMGTPGFAVPSLDALVRASFEVAAVYTQPDKPAGRGRKVTVPPVKQRAEEHGLRVMQPPSLRPPAVVDELRSLGPETIAVAAYGKLLPQAVLDVPPRGVINLHPSLLPRHRGASPVAGAILAGDTVTGVTIMLLDAGMDTGPILAQRQVEIRPDDTMGSLSERLAAVGAALLAETLSRWLAGEIGPVAQDDRLATYSGRLDKDDGRMDWSLPAAELERRVRAFHPWPGCHTSWKGTNLKILQARTAPAPSAGQEPGTVVSLPADGEQAAGVVTGEGVLRLDRVQPEGRQPMAAREFLAGRGGFIGTRLPS